MEYSVNISNKFGNLDDEADVNELVARAAKEKKEKAKQAKATASAKPAAAPPVAAPKAVNKDNKENIENRRPPGQNRGPRVPRPPKDNADAIAERFGEKPRPPREPRDYNRTTRPNFKPRREGEAFQGKRSENRPENENAVDESAEGGRRRFPPRRDGGVERPRGPRGPRTDRVSGSEKTGVRSVPKKDGHGRGNWGDDKDELVGETETANAEETPKVENGGEVVENENTETKVEEEVVEEEPPKLTLEEWKAKQHQEKPVFKTRKANEGADQKTLQKFVPLKKDDEDDTEEIIVEEIALTKRSLREKPLDIQVNFNDPNRREARGPRGPPRDVREGGGNFNRGPRPGPPNRGGPRRDNRGPQIDLAHDFPALGAH